MGYTNSPLVSYTKLSPNHSGQRTHSIDRITPHCVVGQCSVESLGNVFANPSRQASSNYGIGVDGRVGMYVEEKNRSWCSSSNANDQRAVTIECASDNIAPYTFKDIVYAKLVDLCVDICQRNGKNKILWFPTKDQRLNYNPQSNEMVFTLHRDLAATACVPTYTEVLTKTGWKRIDEVEIGEEIASADLDNLNISFEEVYDKVPIKKQDTYTCNDLTVTMDHRLVYSTSPEKDWRIDYFKNLYSPSNQYYIPLAGHYNAEGMNISDDMLKFLIAVQADGHYMYENRPEKLRKGIDKLYIGLEFHLKKERKIERIKEILTNIKLNWKENYKSDGSVSIRIYNYEDVNIVQDICEQYLHEKDFTWDWLNLSAEQADLFLSEILLWDGCIAGNKYTSKHPINLEIVSAISALNNKGSRIRGSDVIFRNVPYITLGGEAKVKRNTDKINTEVTCVSVKTGIFLARQNGKTFIIGNCPGEWLVNRMQDLADKVNAKLSGSTPTPSPTPTPSNPFPPCPTTTTEQNEKVIWDYLMGKLNNAYGTAGMMGNLFAESSLRPENLQNTFEKRLGMSDTQYADAVNNGSYTNFVHDSAGWGLAQWTFWSRKDGLQKLMKQRNKPIYDLNTQLDWLWQELNTSYKGTLNIIKNATTVQQASDEVLVNFEHPGAVDDPNKVGKVKAQRLEYSMIFYNRYSGSTPTPQPTPTPTPTGSYVFQGVDYSSVFEPNYYSDKYSDLKKAFGNDAKALFNHFTTYGMKEARQAIATFNPIIYRSKYKDLQDAFGSNWPEYYKHYCVYGIKEGRSGV